MRIPAWAHDWTLSLPYTVEKGYAAVRLPAGVTELAIRYAAPPVKVTAHPWVEADVGRVAVRRGPVLYCLEKPGDFDALDPVLSAEPPELRPDGSVTVRTADGEVLGLTEYRSWNNRGKLPMRVWLQQAGLSQDPCDLTGWEGKLYREL